MRTITLAAAALMAVPAIARADEPAWAIMGKEPDLHCEMASAESTGAASPDEAEKLLRATHLFKSRTTQRTADGETIGVTITMTSGHSAAFFPDIRLCRFARILMGKPPE
jgi:hypothetical protein